MEERLQWIKRAPEAWADWEPVRGGQQAHALVAQRYPQARVHVVEPQPERAAIARDLLAKPWWKRLGGSAVAFGPVPATGRTVRYRGATFCRVVDGLVVEVSSVNDLFGLLQQLGVEVSPPTA